MQLGRESSICQAGLGEKCQLELECPGRPAVTCDNDMQEVC
jgi:hypothetical protein